MFINIRLQPPCQTSRTFRSFNRQIDIAALFIITFSPATEDDYLLHFRKFREVSCSNDMIFPISQRFIIQASVSSIVALMPRK